MRRDSFSTNKGTLLDKFLQKRRAFMVEKYIKKDLVVCDLGCGLEANFLKKIGKKIAKGIGIDIEVNHAFNDKIIDLRQADLNEKLPIESDYVDVAISLAVVEHLENYKFYLSEAFRILKTGGSLLITTPDPKGEIILNLLSTLKMIDNKEIEDHKRYFDKIQMVDILKSIGFSEVNHKKFQLGFNNLFIAKK